MYSGKCGQRSPRSACASAQSDQGLLCPLKEWILHWILPRYDSSIGRHYGQYYLWHILSLSFLVSKSKCPREDGVKLLWQVGLIKGTLANSVDPDQTPQNALSTRLSIKHVINKNYADIPCFGNGPVQTVEVGQFTRHKWTMCVSVHFNFKFDMLLQSIADQHQASFRAVIVKVTIIMLITFKMISISITFEI